MFGSGEDTVPPISGLPAINFCLAVLYIRTGALACCADATIVESNVHNMTCRTVISPSIRIRQLSYYNAVFVARALLPAASRLVSTLVFVPRALYTQLQASMKGFLASA